MRPLSIAGSAPRNGKDSARFRAAGKPAAVWALAEQAARMEARGRQEVDRLAAVGLRSTARPPQSTQLFDTP